MAIEPTRALQRSEGTDPEQERRALIRQHFAPDASPADFNLFLSICDGLDLDPRLGQAYAISRRDGRSGQVLTRIQLGVRGMRVLAQRTGRYGGTSLPQWCGPDGQWTEVWLDDKPPAACKIAVYQQGVEQPTWGLALYKEFVQTRRDASGKVVPTGKWADMPANQLAVAAERQALNKAFQHDLAAARRVLEDFGVAVADAPAEDLEAVQEVGRLPSPPVAALPSARGRRTARTDAEPGETSGGGVQIHSATDYWSACRVLLGIQDTRALSDELTRRFGGRTSAEVVQQEGIAWADLYVLVEANAGEGAGFPWLVQAVGVVEQSPLDEGEAF